MMSKPFPFTPPTIIHEFNKDELVKDLELLSNKKHWWSRKRHTLYILTNKGVYEMRIK